MMKNWYCFGSLAFIYVLLSQNHESESLSSRPIRKVVIIGSGIAGLSTAHALQTQDLDISIFDARPKLDTQAGAGVQLNGGLAALGKISPALQQAVVDAGLPQAAVQSRAKSWWQQSAGDKSFDTLLSLDLRKVVQSAAPELMKNDEILWISIMRGALQKALIDNLPQKVSFGKRLEQIVEKDSGAFCFFDDGSEAGPFDLVIGCDGIRSVVKDFVAGASNTLYSGIRIRFAIQDGDPKQPQEDEATLTQYFANGAYALDGVYGAGKNKPNTRCSFLVYLDSNYVGPFRVKEDRSDQVVIGENADWTQDVKQNSSKESMLQQVESYGIPDQDNALSSVISNAARFFELGVYFHNPFTRWCRPIGKDGSTTFAVLCGDAAHAIPPFLGQGSNQAIQDAYCLATKIEAYNQQFQEGSVTPTDDIKGLEPYLNDYQRIRWPAVFGILWKSAFLGYLETGGREGLYAKFRDVFFRTMGLIGVAKMVLLSAAKPKLD